jgi:NAD(P)-dependent dehydrogenase (short-subunit alcohol dehydrogenase family)
MKPTAIITAASKGMGAATAQELAARGYNLVLMSRSADIHSFAETFADKTSVHNTSVHAVQGSVTEEQDLKRLVETAIDKFGRIDALVNNTGHPPKGKTLALSDDDWRTGFDLIFMSVIRLMRLVTPVMEKQQKGAIVNISSFAALEPSVERPVSSTMRAALANFTKLFAREYAHANIRMNSLLPGYVDSYNVTPETLATIPMGRVGTVEEVAKTIAFLLSDDAAFITGQNIIFDGGMTQRM